MASRNESAGSPALLRQHAEGLLQESDRQRSDVRDLSPERITDTVHELRVHQIELELQNEELRRTQQELDEARTRYFDLYDLAPVGYVTVDESGLIVEANLTAAALFGRPKSALFKRPFSTFVVANDQDTYYLNRRVLLGAGPAAPRALDLQLVKQDGTSFWGHLTMAVALDPGAGRTCRIVLTDITQQRQADDDIDRLQTRLIQAQKMESVARLAGGVAHDFNNMLGVILGHVEMAIEHVAPTQPIHATLTEIGKAAAHSAELTRRLLAFARKQAIAPVVLDPNVTLAGMLPMVRRLVGEHIELVWRPATDAWPIKMDPSQIEQILVNLCANSRDAISGRGTITMETRNETFDVAYCDARTGFAPGDYVSLAVTDDGCGMDKARLPHLFEPFFTTKSAAAGEGGSLGLGLSTVYGIVRQNDGFLNVFSEPGVGTTFTVYLRRHIGASAHAPAIPTTWEEPGRGTILLVENESAILSLTTTMLARHGYTVLAADTSTRAIEIATTYPDQIDLLMTNVVMPDTNGCDLAKQIVTLRPNAKRLFTSGYTSDVIAHHGALDQEAHFIGKPFSYANLGAKIRDVLRRA